MSAQIFSLLSARQTWLSQRQAVLAQNVANADTPAYVPHDLEPFAEALRRRASRIPSPSLAVTNPAHLTVVEPKADMADDRRVKSFETAPSGNAVVLEEEVQKVAATRMDHALAIELYSKSMGFVRLAAGASG